MLGEYLSFRRMITPVFIQVIFWIAVVAIVIAGIVQITRGAPVEGVLMILLGPLAARIYAELLIVIFRIHENVADIRGSKQAPTPPPGI